MPTYFSDTFGVPPATLRRYGAFNISIVTDLPLFIDPFLLFNSKKAKYQTLHAEMIRYLRFLRHKADTGPVSPGLLKAWYYFPEVKQTWLGFSQWGNAGSGLGRDFAVALRESLHDIFTDFGREKLTKGSHLEKLCLINRGVGRDKISDFTSNLIKQFLCEYTEHFAKRELRADQRRLAAVRKARFNYATETWEAAYFDLPWLNDQYVLLTPKDLLTRDETWINRPDLIRDFDRLPEALPNDQLRAQVNNYFAKVLGRRPGREPRKQEMARAAGLTILKFPQLIDAYIKYKEDNGEQATSLSAERVRYSQRLYVEQFHSLQASLAQLTGFYQVRGDTYQEAHQRLAYLKDFIENKGGHRFFYLEGSPIQREQDIHIMYRLTWFGTPSDVSREANDGRGPADFKISRGSRDKTIVEFKLAKNGSLRRNLERQVEIYKKASDARHSIKAIVYFSERELKSVTNILKALDLLKHPDVMLIDARMDNKPAGSKA